MTGGEPPGAPARVLVVLGNRNLHGQERANIQVFAALKERGVDALFVTHAAWGHEALQPYLDGLGLRWATLPFARHFTRRTTAAEWPRNLARVAEGSRAFRRLLGTYRPTHVHLANPHYALAVLPALYASRVPVVYAIGDAPTEHHVLHRVLWRRLIVPRVGRFVCVSEFVRQRLVASGADARRARVVYPDPPARPPRQSDLPADLAGPAAAPFAGRTVAYVGQITAQKGVHLLVDAAVALCRERPDVRFLVAGRIPSASAFGRALARRVIEAGLTDRIRFLGYVEDVPGLLALADVHACPSVAEEALGLVVMEAKAAGRPSIVLPTAGGPPEIVTDGDDGVVCRAATAEALAEGLQRLLVLDDAALAAQGAAARASLEQLGATPETFARKWAEVYGTAS